MRRLLGVGLIGLGLAGCGYGSTGLSPGRESEARVPSLPSSPAEGASLLYSQIIAEWPSSPAVADSLFARYGYERETGRQPGVEAFRYRDSLASVEFILNLPRKSAIMGYHPMRLTEVNPELLRQLKEKATEMSFNAPGAFNYRLVDSVLGYPEITDVGIDLPAGTWSGTICRIDLNRQTVSKTVSKR